MMTLDQFLDLTDEQIAKTVSASAASNSDLAIKLYKLQFDPYKQCEMFGEDGVVWNLTATMLDGTTERIDVTFNAYPDICGIDNPHIYKLHQMTPEGYKQIAWEQIVTIQ